MNGNFYINQEYFAVQTEWLVKTRRKELKNRIDRLEKAVSKKNINFLDVGCGEGNASLMAMERGWHVTAIDITDNRGETAKKSEMNFYEGELTSLKLQEGGFDVVYMDSVLEHVINPVDYLNEIFRLLKKEGVLYIGVPNEDALQNDVKKIIYNLTGKKGIAPQLKPFDTPYHIVGFNKKSIKYIINKCGFNILELRNFGRKCEFLGSPVGSKGFYFNLLMLPFEVLGYALQRDVYYEAILIKTN